MELSDATGVGGEAAKEGDKDITVDDDEGEDREDVKEGHACWGYVEGPNITVHCGALLDEERSHLGEDY